jgi:RNA polymerase primary sigma factor
MEQKLFRLFREKGSVLARNRIIMSHTRFLRCLVKQYKQPIFSEELFQEAVLGLINATSSYDYNSNNRFISYAVWHARAYIGRFLTDKCKVVRLPSNKQDRVLREMRQDSTAQHPISIIGIDAANCLTSSDDIESMLTVNQEKKITKEFLSILEPNDVKVIKLLYGIDTDDQKTLRDVGDLLGCSGERVRQKNLNIIKKLRQYAKANKIEL